MAQLAAAGKDTGIARRKLIIRSAGAAAGIFGLGLGVAAIAPLVRNPWKGGAKAALWTTGWAPELPRRGRLHPGRHRRPPRDQAGAPRGPGRGLDADGVPVPRVRARRRARALRGAQARRQPRHAHPAAPRHAGDPGAGPGELPLRRLLRLLEDLHPPGLPDVAVRGADPAHPLPVPPVAVHRDGVRQARFRSRGSPAPPTSDYRERRGLPHRHRGLLRADRTRPSGSLGATHEFDHHPDERRCGSGREGGRRAGRARPALPPGRGAAEAVQQGLPDALVVHARRGRALQLHRAAADGHLPRAVLRPVDERGHLRRARSPTCAASR